MRRAEAINMEPNNNPPCGAGDNNQPLFHAPFNEPQPAAPPTLPVDSQPKAKFGLLLTVIAGSELLVIIILAIAVMAHHAAAPTATKTNPTSTDQSIGPQTATSTNVQVSSDSINQDISTLNDDKDFPTDKLSDKTLGL